MQNGITSPFSEFLRQINITALRIPSIRITDVIDILLVACLVYIIIRWVKETRAWSHLRGQLIIILNCLMRKYLHF